MGRIERFLNQEFWLKHFFRVFQTLERTTAYFEYFDDSRVLAICQYSHADLRKVNSIFYSNETLISGNFFGGKMVIRVNVVLNIENHFFTIREIWNWRGLYSIEMFRHMSGSCVLFKS